jgi:hypothetical protein
MYLLYINIKTGGRNTAVGIATRYGSYGPGIECLWARDIPRSSDRPKPTQVVYNQEVKRPECATDHLPTSSAG